MKLFLIAHAIMATLVVALLVIFNDDRMSTYVVRRARRLGRYVPPQAFEDRSKVF